MNQIATLHTTLKATDDEYQKAKNLSESLASQEIELNLSIQKMRQSVEKQDIQLAKLREENFKTKNEYWNMVEIGKRYESELVSLQNRCKSLTQYLGDQTYSFITNSEETKKKMQAKVDNAIAQNLWSMQIQSNESQSLDERKSLREEETLKSRIFANEQENLERMLDEEREDLLMLTAVLNHETQEVDNNYQSFHQTPTQSTSYLSPNDSKENDIHMKNTEEFYETHGSSNICYDYHTITTTMITEEEVIDIGTNEATDFADNNNFYVNETGSTPWFQKRKRKSNSSGSFRTGAEILYSTSQHP